MIPPVIAKRKKRRLKCAFTVRLAILSCRAISELSQPCSSSSAICCSRGPSRIELSFIPTFPLVQWFGPGWGDYLNRSNSCAVLVESSLRTEYSKYIWVSPEIHSMLTAKLALNFTFASKVADFPGRSFRREPGDSKSFVFFKQTDTLKFDHKAPRGLAPTKPRIWAMSHQWEGDFPPLKLRTDANICRHCRPFGIV